MKQTITKTIRLCAACGRPGYHNRELIAPCYVPLCGTCVAWAKLIDELTTAHGRMIYPLTHLVRILVRGSEREGMAHKLTLMNAQRVVENLGGAK